MSNMKLFEDERIIWQSGSGQIVLTTHRLRSRYRNGLKSIMLEELKACEQRTIRQPGFLRYAIIYFLLFNGIVYLLNNFLFRAELIRVFFGQAHIGPESARLIFYISLVIAVGYIVLFLSSVKKVYSFYGVGMTLNIRTRSVEPDIRRGFIGLIEETKDKRLRSLGFR